MEKTNKRKETELDKYFSFFDKYFSKLYNNENDLSQDAPPEKNHQSEHLYSKSETTEKGKVLKFQR